MNGPDPFINHDSILFFSPSAKHLGQISGQDGLHLTLSRIVDVESSVRQATEVADCFNRVKGRSLGQQVTRRFDRWVGAIAYSLGEADSDLEIVGGIGVVDSYDVIGEVYLGW